MALSAFEGVATAQQIVAAALRHAGSPDLHLDSNGNETLDAPAYIELQWLLDHLAMAHDWPFTRTALSVPILSRENPLPATFWRASVDDPLWLVSCDGTRSRVHLDDEGEFFSALPGTGSPEGTPTRFWIQKSSQTLFVDPVPEQAYVGEFHFQPWQVPLSAIDSRPWFPWSEYLVAALAVKLCLNQDDSRAAAEQLRADKLMKEIRHSLSDQGERTSQVRLNPNVYRRPLRL